MSAFVHPMEYILYGSVEMENSRRRDRYVKLCSVLRFILLIAVSFMSDSADYESLKEKGKLKVYGAE